MNFLFPLLILALFVAIITVIIVLLAYYRSKGKSAYDKIEFLLTPNEQKFFFILKSSLEDRFLLFSKVRLFDIFKIRSGMSNSDYYSYRNKIQSKHVDFLICDKETTKPLLAIELDDSSHLKLRVIERDSFVDQVFEQAQLPILHVKSEFSYNGENLKKKISEILS